MSRRARSAIVGSLSAALLASAGFGEAQEARLPATLTITAYETGSSGFNIAVAVGRTLKDFDGVDLRVLPAGNDVARLAPLKANRAQASAMGIGGYFAQEGVFEFAVREFGPQQLRLILSVVACNGISLGVAKDTGVQHIKDLHGKRIGLVVGSPALNQNAFAILAYGGLTPSEVKLIEFSSNVAMWKGMANNEIDAAVASNISGQVREVETSPRGIVFPPTPRADEEAWARLKKIAPYYQPHQATCGSGVPAGGMVELPTYPYPAFTTYASQPAELIYNLTKAMIANYGAYKDVTPGASGLDVKRQNLSWVLPYHEGAIKALREAGVWKPEHDAYDQKLVERQRALAAAWAAFMTANPPADKKAFADAWVAARKAALARVGIEPVFE